MNASEAAREEEVGAGASSPAPSPGPIVSGTKRGSAGWWVAVVFPPPGVALLVGARAGQEEEGGGIVIIVDRLLEALSSSFWATVLEFADMVGAWRAGVSRVS